DFDRGLNVLTGETGAGKSIILGAIRLGLGGRSSGNVIRNGADKAVIQVVFVVDDRIAERLSETVDTSDGMVIFRREMHRGGKSIMRLNDCVVTLNQAAKVANLLLNIHGQSDYQLLFDSEGQLSLVDAFLEQSASRIKSDLAAAYHSLFKIKKQLDSLSDQPELIEREIDLIKFQMDDIDSVELTDDDEDVEARYKKINQATQLIQRLSEMNYTIENEDVGDLTRLLNHLSRSAGELIDQFPSYGEAIEKIDDFSFFLAEFQRDICADIDALTIDEAERSAIENRLDAVNALKKKYGQTIDDIATYRLSLDERLATLQNIAVEKETLSAAYHRQKEIYLSLNTKLLTMRKRAADAFVKVLREELAELQFSDVALEIVFNKRKQFTELGCEDADIRISFNRGVAAESLRKIASGGEISRLMLAIKNIVAERDRVPVLIFDEIDSGISGLTAGVVADKLYRVARYHQVICISHLAQVALMADRHFLIVKDTMEDLAISRVYPLTKSQRVAEIARLISGKRVDAMQLQHAEQLLARAMRDQRDIANTIGVK
ncbi:MAG: hypothetical protein CSB19_01195, partial [Clostridiales bacterium]